MELNFKKYGDLPETVIIVHGLFGMLDNWHNIAKKLSENYTVYTIDVRNHGNSPHSSEMNYTVMCEDIKNFMHAQHITSASFIGHSMGGKIVMKLAGLFPELINKLIVVDIAPKKYKPGHLELFDAMFKLPVEEFSSRQEADDALSQRIHNQSIRQFLLKNIQRNKSGNGFQWKMNLPVIFENYEEIIGEIEYAWPFSNEALFINGGKSDYVTPADQADIVERFPNVSFEEIPNVGHWVHAENPTAFVNIVSEFLAN